MQDCIDGYGKGYSTQGAIKNLFGHLDRFAMELDIISKCCSDLLTSAPIPEISKEIFTDEEVARIWDNQKLEWVDSILFFLYTGFRISEMIDLKTETVDLEAGTITGGTKTAAGKIMGHKSKGTCERVYTHKNIEELKMNIELITN